MNLWEEARKMHEQCGQDWKSQLSYYMHYGYILSCPDCLVFAEPIGDAWAIQIAVGDGCIPKFIQAMPFWMPKIAWRRALRAQHGIKKIDTERMCRFFHINPEHLKGRQR